MRIDAKGTIRHYPALLVRTTLRHLRSRLSWGLAELEAAAGLKPGDGRALVKTLRSEGLIEAVGHGAWEVTQAGRTFSSATAAKRITRATAGDFKRIAVHEKRGMSISPFFGGRGGGHCGRFPTRRPLRGYTRRLFSGDRAPHFPDWIYSENHALLY
jgi:hypothetical protein